MSKVSAAANTDDEEASKLSIESPAFDPKAYVRHEHAGMSYAEFTESVLPEVEGAEHDADTNIKKLVQTHLGTFIECKDSMDNLYRKEETLFEGDALQSTEKEFDDVLQSVTGATKELLQSFQLVKNVRGQQETLAKLMGVLRTPGDIYRCCGCRVLRHTMASASNTEGLLNDGDDELDISRSSSSSDNSNNSYQGESAADALGGRRGLFGVTSNHMASSTQWTSQLQRGEEIAWWCGVPLARRRVHHNHHSPSAVNDTSDYDSGVQALRVALSFLESHYDLVKGTCLDATEGPEQGEEKVGMRQEGGTSSPSSNKATPPPSSPTSNSPRDLAAAGSSAVGGANSNATPFVFYLARALLTSALFLNEILFSSLQFTNHGDAVRVESILNLMKELSSASVRLRHFCVVMREELLRNTATGNALSTLQNALEMHNDEDGRDSDDGTASEVGTTKSASRSEMSRATSFVSAESREQQSRVEAATRIVQRMHPVEAYLKTLRDHHSRAILRHAAAWARQADATQHRSECRKRRSASAALYNSNSAAASNFAATLAKSTQLGATVHNYELGNLMDSFAVRVPAPKQNATNSRSGRVSSLLDNNASFMATIAVANGSFELRPTDAFGDVTASMTPLERDDVMTRSVLQEHQPPVAPVTEDEDQVPASVKSLRPSTERNIVLAGTLSLRPLLEGSSDQLLDHALYLSRRIEQQPGESVQQLMAQCDAITTPLSQFIHALCSDTEHRVSAYWRGIGSTIHGGRMLDTFDEGSPLRQALEGRAFDGINTLECERPEALVQLEDVLAAQLPPIHFIPVVSDSTAGGGASSSSSRGTAKKQEAGDSNPLLDKSVATVKRMLWTACEMACRVIRAFGRHVSTNGLLCTIVGPDIAIFEEGASNPTLSSGHAREERMRFLEIRVTVAVEVIIAHMESVIEAIVNSTTQLKTSIGETARRDQVTNDAQMAAMVDILCEAEKCRNELLRSCFFVIELVAKVFALTITSVVCGGGRNSASGKMESSTGGLHPRLSKTVLSTSLPSKCFNLLLMIADRASICFQRHQEVFFGLETMFSNPTDEPNKRRKETRASKSKTGSTSTTMLDDFSLGGPDPVAAAVAHYNCQLVVSNTMQEMERLEELMVNIMTSFVDGIHLRCHTTTNNSEQQGPPNTNNNVKDKGPSNSSVIQMEVECLGDLSCLSTLLPTLVTEHILGSTVYAVTSRLAQYNGNASGKGLVRPSSQSLTPVEQQIVKTRKEQFCKTYVPIIQEMAFVASEAVLAKVISSAEAQIFDIMQRDGFIMPNMDWKLIPTFALNSNNSSSGGGGGTISRPVTSAITIVRARQYLIDGFLCIASLQESLARLNVPAVAFAVVLRLSAFMTRCFSQCFQSGGGGYFEFSHDRSAHFFVLGVLLLEVEGTFLLRVMKQLLDAAGSPLWRNTQSIEASRVRDASEDLSQASSIVEIFVRALGDLGVGACEQLLKQKKATGLPDFDIPSAQERKSMRDNSVQAALDSSKLVIDSLSSFVDAAAAAMQANVASGASSSAITASAVSLALEQRTSQRRGLAAAGMVKEETPSHTDTTTTRGRLASRFARRGSPETTAAERRPRSVAVHIDPTLSDSHSNEVTDEERGRGEATTHAQQQGVQRALQKSTTESTEPKKKKKKPKTAEGATGGSAAVAVAGNADDQPKKRRFAR